MRPLTAEAILDSMHTPLIVVDSELMVIVANRAFCDTFHVSLQDTIGKILYDLGNGQWNIKALRAILGDILPTRSTVEEYEVEHEFPGIGRRIMALNARQVRGSNEILLVIEDITDRRYLERHKDLLMYEMEHRINNSLQIIANILMIKAKAVQSDESRHHLFDARERVISVATVQQHLSAVSLGASRVFVGPYLKGLCDSLQHSMIPYTSRIIISVKSDIKQIASVEAVRLGLVVTELVINSIKHAFGDHDKGTIDVNFVSCGLGWGLSVVDSGNGIGSDKAGLGRGIVEALSHQMGAKVSITTGSSGTSVSLVNHE